MVVVVAVVGVGGGGVVVAVVVVAAIVSLPQLQQWSNSKSYGCHHGAFSQVWNLTI